MEEAQIRLLDNETLTPISTTLGNGIVGNVYNAKIRKGINGVYDASFDITPSTDASKIKFPSIVELDDDYFRVANVTKSRQNNIDITIDLEHISYELNKLKKNKDGEYEDKLEKEEIYSGYLYFVIGRILNNTRFDFTVDPRDMLFEVQDFVTSTAGIRSRLIELAKHIGREIEFDKFKIHFKRRVGADHGLVLEVGKNIRGLNYQATTDAGDKVVTSLEVEMLDLAHTSNPEELFGAELGDTIQVVDNTLKIDSKERIVSIEYDPFQKALPTIEIENVIADTATKSSLSNSGNTNIILFDDVNASDFVLTSTPTQILNHQILVVRSTYFDISSTLTFEATSNGVLAVYLYLDGVEQIPVYRKSVGLGWETITITKLITKIPPGRKSLSLFLSFTGSGKITIRHAEMITRATGVIGGIDNTLPDQAVADSVPIPSLELSVGDVYEVIVKPPIKSNPHEYVEFADNNIIPNVNTTVELLAVAENTYTNLSLFARMSNYTQYQTPSQSDVDTFITNLHATLKFFALIVTDEQKVRLIATNGTKMYFDTIAGRVYSDETMVMCDVDNPSQSISAEYLFNTRDIRYLEKFTR